jgi:hypothetical protein
LVYSLTPFLLSGLLFAAGHGTQRLTTVGVVVGGTVGSLVGRREGEVEGNLVGDSEGPLVGGRVGRPVGCKTEHQQGIGSFSLTKDTLVAVGTYGLRGE